MSEESEAKSESRYAQVPADFPWLDYFGSVLGAQPKLLLTRYRGRFYAPGCMPPAVWQRWDICEDLAQQLYRKSLESKRRKRVHMDESARLEVLPDVVRRGGCRSQSWHYWSLACAPWARKPSPLKKGGSARIEGSATHDIAACEPQPVGPSSPANS